MPAFFIISIIPIDENDVNILSNTTVIKFADDTILRAKVDILAGKGQLTGFDWFRQ